MLQYRSMRRVIINNSAGGYALLVGGWESTARHRHFALHLNLAFDGSLELRVDNSRVVSPDAVAVAANAPHEVLGIAPREGVVMNVAPFTNLGIFLREKLAGRDCTELSDPHLNDIRSLGRRLLDGRLSHDEFLRDFDMVVGKIVAEPFAQQLERYDQRIVGALAKIFEDPDSLVPAEELAASVGLSTSRFLHLFRSELGITFRRMEIWIRLARVFSAFERFESFTELAHEFGFSDSSHFSRAFKETFGYSPSAYFARSRFVQANSEKVE